MRFQIGFTSYYAPIVLYLNMYLQSVTIGISMSVSIRKEKPGSCKFDCSGLKLIEKDLLPLDNEGCSVEYV